MAGIIGIWATGESNAQMDEADLTGVRAEFEEAQLAKARAAKSVVTLVFTECRYCEEPLSEGRQLGGFCSPECRDDFEQAQAALLRTGTVRRA
jgi:hypothetical protein